MKFNRLLAIAALSLAAAPIAATAQDTSRESASVSNASNLGADGPTITALVAIAALIAGVIIVADGEDDDAPVSP
tara:strand:- start:5398 stop:5622 length:225 start_codon:yes stop_codon:yes gene_type:complete